MLQNIRDRFTGPTALVVLGLIAIPFIFVGVSSPLIGSGYAAKVDGEEISLQAFQMAWQNQINQNPELLDYPAQYQSMLRKQILDQLVLERLVANYVDDAGIRVTDAMVTDLIQQMPAFQADGEFSLDEYRNALSMQGREPREFEASVKQSLRQFQLQQSIATTAFVTPAEYRRYLNLQAEQRQVTVATIAFEDIKSSVAVTDEEIQAFYDERPDEFYTDETVDLEYIEVLRDDLAATATIGEQDLLNYYEESSNRYLQDEQRRASHILIPFGDDEDGAREETEALTARVQAGEPFEDLARTHSKDGTTANNGGDLGVVLQSQMPGALGDAIFSMRKSEVRGPVRSDFGFHVVRLDEIIEGGPLPLDQVRVELERELRDRAADAEFRNIETTISNALFDGLDMQAISEATGREVKTATAYTRSGGEPFGTNQAVIDAVFESRVLNDGETSDVIEIDANRSAVVRVAQYHEALRKPLDEVRDQIRGALQSAAAQGMIADRSEKLESAWRSGEDVAAVAAELGATLSEPRLVSRQDTSVDARLLAAIFRASKPAADSEEFGSSVTQSGDYAVFSVSAVIPGRPETIPLPDRDARKQQLANQAGAADFTAFLGALQSRADIALNEEVLRSEDTF